MAKNKDNKEAIKKMEAEKRAAAHKTMAAAKPADSEEKVSFDEWYAQRSGSIPKIHRKEILKADFKARGCGAKASLACYDKALGKYGVKLKK